MPDDFDAPSVSGKEEARKTAEFNRLCGELGVAVENPWYPDAFPWFGPEREKFERDNVRRALRAASRDYANVLRLVRAHIGDEGNHKLPMNYLTFNMSSGHGCPSLKFRGDGTLDLGRTTCQAFTPDGMLDCYAIRDEQSGRKKHVWTYRTRQNELWTSLLQNEPDILIDVIANMAAMARSEETAKNALRFQVAGDFPDQPSVDAFMYVADQLGRIIEPSRAWGLPFITYTYTARRSLDFRAARRIDTAVIMGSNMSPRKHPGITATFMYVMEPDDAPEEKGTGARYGNWPEREWSFCHGFYKAKPKGTVPADKYGCRGCRRCLLGLNSVVVRHAPPGRRHKPLDKAVYVPRRK